MASLRVERLTKQYEAAAAVSGISLEVAPGELFTVLGPSGCGKTTLLRLLAGLERPDDGTVLFGKERVDQSPTHRRNVGMVFQSYALFPHLTVAENVAYGLRTRRLPEPEVQARVAEALAQVRLTECEHRSPDRLSGGQQQRAALARALAARPALLLMDEPLSGLDAGLRLAMREEIRRIVKQAGITTVYVTHDQEEALAISDRIAVMEEGRIVQVGTPSQIYLQPATKSVAKFVGTCSFLAAEMADEHDVAVGGQRFEWPPPRASRPAAGTPLEIGLRPEALKPLPPGWAPPDAVTLAGVVEQEIFAGSYVLVEARLRSGETVRALSMRAVGTFPRGAKLALAFEPPRALFFDLDGRAVR